MKLAKRLAAAVALVFVLAGCQFKPAGSYVTDEMGLFSAAELSALEQQAQAASANAGVDIVILASDNTSGKTTRRYIEDFYNANYGKNGVSLFIDLDEGEIYIDTSGKPETWIDDWFFDKTLDSVYDYAVEDDFTGAASDFITRMEGELVRVQALEKANFWPNLLPILLRSLLISAAVTGIVILIMLSRGKPKVATSAHAYKGEVRVTHAQDYFITSNTTRTAIPQNNGSGGGGGGGGGGRSSYTSSTRSSSSSSGRSHSGGGRKL